MLKIKLQPGQQLYLTSDTHFKHTNICRGVTKWRNPDGSIPVDQTRDFNTLEQMNAAIVNNINSTVGQDDILLHFGDWSFGGFESIKEFRDRIVCRNIHLILGNHDHHIKNNRGGCRDLFTTVNPVLELLVESQDDRNGIKNFEAFCMHYPVASWPDMNKGRFHLHGHVHLPPSKKLHQGRAMDVGVDGHPDFKPYSLAEVINLLKDHPIKKLVLPQDHHEERLKGEQ